MIENKLDLVKSRCSLVILEAFQYCTVYYHLKQLYKFSVLAGVLVNLMVLQFSSDHSEGVVDKVMVDVNLKYLNNKSILTYKQKELKIFVSLLEQKIIGSLLFFTYPLLSIEQICGIDSNLANTYNWTQLSRTQKKETVKILFLSNSVPIRVSYITLNNVLAMSS